MSNNLALISAGFMEKDRRYGEPLYNDTQKLLTAFFFVFLIIIGLTLTKLNISTIEEVQEVETLIPPDVEVPLPPSFSQVRIFKNGVVNSDASVCSKVGRDILQQNGSAVDSAIAALFCNGLLNMQSMGLGGGFLMNIYIKDMKKAFTLNARETAPKAALNVTYGDDEKTSRTGRFSIAVPGELSGYWAAHQRFGLLPWKQLIEPSINICNSGYHLSPSQRSGLFMNPLFYSSNEISRKWFTNPKTSYYLSENELVRPSELCETLRIIAENDGNVLYNGKLAQVFVQDIQEMGGVLTLDDLAAYRPEWSESKSVLLKNDSLLMHTVDLPGSGPILSFIMNVIDQYKFVQSNDVESSALMWHRIMETFKFAYAKRTQLGDKNFVPGVEKILKKLLSQTYAQQIQMKIMDFLTNPNPEYYGAVYADKSNHGTAHLSVLAANGDAVSVTSSLNMYFGSGLISRRTGVVLNSCMDDFSNTGYHNYFHLPASPFNFVAPGKRAMSSMNPTIITDRNGNVKLIIGAAGGTKITTAIALFLFRYFYLNETVKEAVDGPRLHHQLTPMRIEYEFGLLKPIIDSLKSRGHEMYRYRNEISVLNVIAVQNGDIVVATDVRKPGGDAFGY